MTQPSHDPFVVRSGAVEPIARGGGIQTVPLVGRWNNDSTRLTSGMTTFVPGTMIRAHSHNVEETVMVLEGTAVAQIGDERYDLLAHEVTWIPAGVEHYFANESDSIMRIYWVYAGREVTRTMVDTGETIEHLGDKDRGIGSSLS
jgi:HTH-type transcriptional regulator, repressor for puuD